MAISQKRSKRKPTGGRYKSKLSKKLYELGNDPTLTKLEEVKRASKRIKGNNRKTKLLSSDSANVFNPSTKKSKVVKIKGVVENTANVNYVRRNFLTKSSCVFVLV